MEAVVTLVSSLYPILYDETLLHKITPQTSGSRLGAIVCMKQDVSFGKKLKILLWTVRENMRTSLVSAKRTIVRVLVRLGVHR